jgi:hypothetical protein
MVIFESLKLFPILGPTETGSDAFTAQLIAISVVRIVLRRQETAGKFRCLLLGKSIPVLCQCDEGRGDHYRL